MPSGRNNFLDYCANSSAHVLSYIVEPGSTALQRLWWIVNLVLCVFIIVLILIGVLVRWSTVPNIIMIDENPRRLDTIPFPAVTICDESKYDSTKFNTSWKGKGREPPSDPDDVDEAGLISLMCSKNAGNASRQFLTDSDLSFLHSIFPNPEELIHLCKWKVTIMSSCEKIFQQVFTDDGYCHAFNLVDSSHLLTSGTSMHYYNETDNADLNWTIESGYTTTDLTQTTSPKRSSSPGIGITVVLLEKPHKYDAKCRFATRGFKVKIHPPTSIPSMTVYVHVPYNAQVRVYVEPRLTLTDSSLRSIDPVERGCYFSGEKELSYFQVYTKENCELECLTKHTLKMCGCVNLSMPRANSSIPYCGGAKKNCVLEAYWEIKDTDRDYYGSMDATVNQNAKKHSVVDCGCLSNCYELDYGYDITLSSYEWKENLMEHGNLNTYYNESVLSKVTVMYKSNSVAVRRRTRSHTYIDILAYFGGIFGLVCGFSLISVLELVYFFFFRGVLGPKGTSDERAIVM